MKRILTIFTAFLTIFAISLSAFASDIRDLQERRQGVQDSVREQRALLAEAQAERNEAMAEVLQMDIDLTLLTYQYLDAVDELASATASLRLAEINLARAEEQREEQAEVLRNRIRFMHENNNFTYIELLFASDNINDFLSNMEHINRIIEHDNGILDNLRDAEARIAQNHMAVAQFHAETVQLNIDLENRIEELETNLAARSRRITELEANEAHYAAMADVLEQEAREIQIAILNAEALAEAQRRARQAAAGRSTSVAVHGDAIFIWPVDAARGINSGYGWRTHPVSGRQEFHEGIDMRATTGTPILAAASGTVVQSQFRRGYGNTVVISHGGGLSTLYAHNSRNVVEVGDWVEQGDLIALAGSTGLSTGPHLHFEVWVNGNHVDPGPYLGLR